MKKAKGEVVAAISWKGKRFKCKKASEVELSLNLCILFYNLGSNNLVFNLFRSESRREEGLSDLKQYSWVGFGLRSTCLSFCARCLPGTLY